MLLFSNPLIALMKKTFLRSHERLFKCGGTTVISENAIKPLLKYHFRPRDSTFAVRRFSFALFQANYSGNSSMVV